MFVQSFAQICEELTAQDQYQVIFNAQIELTLEPSNYDAKPCFLHFTAQKFKCPRRFER